MSKDTQFLTTSAAYVPEPPDPAASTPYHPGSAALIEDYTVTRWAADLREYDLRNPGVLPFAGYYILSARYTHNIIRYSLVLPNYVTSGYRLINHIYIVWELDDWDSVQPEGYFWPGEVVCEGRQRILAF